MSQTYSNLQIILVNDGSTDKSGMICNRYAKEDSRIHVIHKENGGLVSARKAGLELAEGDYIGFVDGDDYIDSSFFITLLRAIQNSQADFVHMGYIYEQNDISVKICQFENEIFELNKKSAVYLINEFILKRNESMEITPSIWSKLYKRKLIRKCYDKVPCEQSYGEDLINMCICLLEGQRMYLVKETLYHYNKRYDSITNKVDASTVLEIGGLYSCLKKVFLDYEISEQTGVNLDNYYLNLTLSRIRKINGFTECICGYLFEGMDEIIGKEIVLYGAGSVGQGYYAQICKYDSCRIVGWVDANYKNIQLGYANVTGTEMIENLHYDVILIAMLNREVALQIKRELERGGIPANKILWKMPRALG